MERPNDDCAHDLKTYRHSHRPHRSCGAHRGDDGAIAVEFVLILPVLLMLMFGVIQFGRAYNAKVVLTGAVREGARVLALGTDDPETVTIDAAAGLDPAAITVTTSGDPCTAGDPATVTASYPFEINIPFWGNPTVNIEASGVMRCNG